MRVAWLIAVGISVLGCKDPAPAQSGTRTTTNATSGTAAPAPVAPPTPAPAAPAGSAAVRAPERPSLDPAAELESEAEDKEWADSTEAQIRAVAPELTEVMCRTQQCRGTLIAANETELVEKAEKLQSADSLPGTDGVKNILLTAPRQKDGKLAMTIYIRYER